MNTAQRQSTTVLLTWRRGGGAHTAPRAEHSRGVLWAQLERLELDEPETLALQRTPHLRPQTATTVRCSAHARHGTDTRTLTLPSSLRPSGLTTTAHLANTRRVRQRRSTHSCTHNSAPAPGFGCIQCTSSEVVFVVKNLQLSAVAAPTTRRDATRCGVTAAHTTRHRWVRCRRKSKRPTPRRTS